MTEIAAPAELSRLGEAIRSRNYPEVMRLALAKAEITVETEADAAADELLDLASWLVDEGRLNEAVALRTRGLEVLARTHPDPRRTAVEICALADLLEARGDATTASELMRIAADLTRDGEGEDSAAYHDRLRALAQLMERKGRVDASEALHDEADALARRHRIGGKRYGNFSLDDASKEAGKERKPLQVGVFYATNRDVRKRDSVYERFGGERNETMNFGIAKVSLPRNRRPGTLVSPSYFWQFYDGYESDSLFLLKGLEALPSREAWLERLREQVQGGQGRELLLYVHGFNTKFWEAMLRAAQLHVDLGIKGTTAAYSWPSRGSRWSYDVDRTSIDVFWPHLKELIAELARPFNTLNGKEKAAPRLIVVAHSMGCEYTLKALERLKLEMAAGKLWDGQPPVSDVIFAAPDVDLAVFQRDVVAVSSLAGRVTTYCSEADVALWLSKTTVHHYERAGRKAEALVGLRLDGIDTTTVAGSPLWEFAHNDYASTALVDIKAVLCGDVPENRVYLDPVRVAHGRYWGMLPRLLRAPDGQSYALSVDARRGTLPLPEPLTI